MMNHSEGIANQLTKSINLSINQLTQIKGNLQTKVLSATSAACIDDKRGYLWPNTPQS